jgi:hypothetical protein
MNHAGLPGRPSFGQHAAIFFIGLFLFLDLSSSGFWYPCAHAEVRRYDWPSVPTMAFPKEEMIQNVNYLCEASKADMGRYSDAAIGRFIDRFRDADAVILNSHNLFRLKELNSVRGRLIRCQSVFKEEQYKRRLRADSGLEEDIKAGRAR